MLFIKEVHIYDYKRNNYIFICTLWNLYAEKDYKQMGNEHVNAINHNSIIFIYVIFFRIY